MRTWTRTAGLLFLAASAVYNGRAVAAGVAKAAGVPVIPGGTDTGTEVRTVPDDAPVAAKDSAKTDSAKSAKAAAKDSTREPAKDSADAKDATASKEPAAPTTAPSTGKSVSASEVAVSQDSGTVEIHVNDANIIEVLRLLSMQSSTNILPSKDVRGSVTVNLYNMTIKEALDAILTSNGYGYREKGNVIYVYTTKELADIDKGSHKPVTEVFHLYYTPAVNAQTMIKPVLSSEGQVAVTTPPASGIESSAKDAGGNTHAIEDMMVITDYPDNLEQVRKILKEIDKRPAQILVEATILRASLNENNALGIDFTLLGGVSFNGLNSNGSSPAELLSGAITGNAKAQNVVHNGAGGANTGFSNGVPAGGLRVGVVTSNVAVFLSALEEVTNTVVMANPKVLVLNKQKGEVKVARMDPFRGKTTTSETGITQQEVDFLETGTLLIFRPYIGDDGFIRLEVHPEDSTPLPSTAADLPPTKLTTETTTNVMVRDGHTVVIGGLFRETSQSSRSQVPGIGNLPFVGALFRNQKDSTQREEVIILLTPHIIKDDAQYSKASEQEKREAERLRVGVRHGMMPFGRERLADCNYQQAVAEWNKPNPDRQKVLWHLNCATNLNPSFSEAIDLKQKVTGKEVTAADNSSIRGFVTREILNDHVVALTEVAPATQTAAAAPATQPSVVAKATPATQPTTQPAAAAPAVASADDEESEDYFPFEGDAPAKAAQAASPATQPSVAKADKKDPSRQADRPSDSQVTITEIPTDEIKDEPAKSDK